MKKKVAKSAPRVAACYQRKREKGLVPFQVWVKPAWKNKIKEFIDTLDK
jgi:hypothetical protein